MRVKKKERVLNAKAVYVVTILMTPDHKPIPRLAMNDSHTIRAI